ncbi:MAG: hypothetical protein HY320_07500 [Armatimonadetes bacterium]|nr:hypothetical protein [Armatimonadota bacterium]
MRAVPFPARSLSFRLAAVLLLVAAALLGAPPRQTAARPAGYTFDVLAALGDPVPGGGDFVFDFEPYAINARGDVAFGADLSTGGEGIFLLRKGQLMEVARFGQPAPGGGVFGPFFIPGVPLNDPGDMAFTFVLEPFVIPIGSHAGVYRFSHVTGAVTPVFVPGVTPAPGGGVFHGATTHASINNRGDIAFAGLVSGADIAPGPPGIDGDLRFLGAGCFTADRRGQIANVVRPGDPAPGGGVFDFAENPWINDAGDVAFGAHVAGEEVIDFGVPQAALIFAAESIYLKKAATGEILSIAHQGQPAPGGGIYRFAFGPVVNNRGQVAFVGDLTPSPGFGEDLGVFLFSGGVTVPVARPGDPMPGGGNLLRASFFASTYHLNNAGEVSFSGRLQDGSDGLYVGSHGSPKLVARTGTVIPGVGTIVALLPPDLVGTFPYTYIGGASNERGQIVFTAAVDDGSGTLQGLLLTATPAP